MAGTLQSGFRNNPNVISVRVGGGTGHVYTDRPIGDVEPQTVTTELLGGNKIRQVVVENDLGPRNHAKRFTETDRGLSNDGQSEFTQNVE